MSALYSAASFVWSSVNWARRKGFAQPVRLPARVVSVGNIQAGGTGKTPIVAAIARESIARGLRVAILSRGYRSKWEGIGGTMIPTDEMINASDCGDEPALLRELLPQAYFGIGANRAESFFRLQERVQKKFDLIVIDDGFQNSKIVKDLEIVLLTDAERDQILFRDFSSALNEADVVIWTKGEIGGYDEFRRKKPCIEIRFQLPRSKIGDGILLVTGVADSQAVRASAAEAGYRIEREISLPDHARYSLSQIEAFFRDAKMENLKIAVTGKDWVKWRELGIERDRLIVLEPEIEFLKGRGIWTQNLWGE